MLVVFIFFPSSLLCASLQVKVFLAFKGIKKMTIGDVLTLIFFFDFSLERNILIYSNSITNMMATFVCNRIHKPLDSNICQLDLVLHFIPVHYRLLQFAICNKK